jgi:hypothetical protein
VPGYGFALSAGFVDESDLAAVGAENGFGAPGLTGVPLGFDCGYWALFCVDCGVIFVPKGTLFGYGFGSCFVADLTAGFPAPAMLLTGDLPAVLADFPPGYLFAPSGTLLVGAAMDFPPIGLLDAGTELERLMAGLRAVEGSAFGEGL